MDADKDLDLKFKLLLQELTKTQHTLPKILKESLYDFISNSLKNSDEPIDPELKKYLVYGWFFSGLLESKGVNALTHGYHD